MPLLLYRPSTPWLRQPLLLLTVVVSVIILLTIVADLRAEPTAARFSSAWRAAGWPATRGPSDPAVAKRLATLRQGCRSPDAFEAMYGRANLRMTRAYEGSRFRIERFINKIIRNEPVVIGIIGGSVTAGHGVAPEERWADQLESLLGGMYPGANITFKNGAIPASGSDYFSFCFPLHIPADDVDLVFVELAVNDEALMEHADNMDNLLRGLLSLPNDPAVMLVEVVAFSNGRMAGGGGRIHLPIAQYYDVPVLNQRWPLVSHFARFPELVPHYFVGDWWGPGTDTRHMGPAGHRDMAYIIGSFMRDVTCDMVAAPDYAVPPREGLVPLLPVQDFPHRSYNTQLEGLFDGDAQQIYAQVAEIQEGWPSETKQWEHEPSEEDLKVYDIREGRQAAPGLWASAAELGMMPRLRAMEDWNDKLDHTNPVFSPKCLSTRAHEAKFNLTPTENNGWYWWVHPNIPDKPYLVAHEPGSTVSFELDITVGVIKLYALHSMSYGFGMVDCWIDEDVEHKVTIDGYWDNPDLNIGRFSTLSETLEPGKHKITCKLLQETNDPGGQTMFRLISVMGR